jgi:hypothetical protein
MLLCHKHFHLVSVCGFLRRLHHSLHFFIRLEATDSAAADVIKIPLVSACLFPRYTTSAYRKTKCLALCVIFLLRLLDALGSSPGQMRPIRYRY